jgi:branched-subunit amino acid transport protein
MSEVLLIFDMALITYAIRSAVFVFGERIAFSPLMRTALSFVPVTVLPAIIVPMVISPHGGSAEITWRNRNCLARSPRVRSASRHADHVSRLPLAWRCSSCGKALCCVKNRQLSWESG